MQSHIFWCDDVLSTTSWRKLILYTFWRDSSSHHQERNSIRTFLTSWRTFWRTFWYYDIHFLYIYFPYFNIITNTFMKWCSHYVLFVWFDVLYKIRFDDMTYFPYFLTSLQCIFSRSISTKMLKSEIPSKLQNKTSYKNKAIKDGKYLTPPHSSAWQRSPH